MRALPLALLLALAACSNPPALALPTGFDWSEQRRCSCVVEGICWTADMAEGEAEMRARQCRWQDRAAGRAQCSYESRFKPAVPARSGWSSWSRTTVNFRHLGEKGWCWTPATGP